MQKYAHSQIDANTKTPHYHDEFKIQLPAVLTAEHHLLFTFFHVDLQMKLEAPKPVCFVISSIPWLPCSASVFFLLSCALREIDHASIGINTSTFVFFIYASTSICYLTGGFGILCSPAHVCLSVSPLFSTTS